MGDKKIAIDKTLSSNQIAAFLRLLADELEGKDNAEPNEFGNQLHGFNKLKISLIKQEGGQLSLRLKIKDSPKTPPAATSQFIDTAEQEYRPFKQQYKATFTELTSCAHSGLLPAAELLARFMSESRKLISFQGFGDPCYDDYIQACLAMEQAVKDGELAHFQEKFSVLNALKKSCHQRYK
ncbi:MAG: GAK system XXXCH domain-containing protein [Desulfobulbaceae bacterium]|nr:GAK system XXXCH domain-containing protein [Desulfobulbaceae bacterium]